MASTYTLISSNVLSSSAASVTFSSIPSTYTDLVLRWSARSTEAGTDERSSALTFNGVSSASYGMTRVQADGSATSSYSANRSQILVNGNPQSGTTANTFGSGEIYIPNYADSTTNNPVSLYGVSENNATTAYITATAGLFVNNAAITSLTLDNAVFGGSGYDTGSSFYLYGIKSS